jgi:hypothetical protein
MYNKYSRLTEIHCQQTLVPRARCEYVVNMGRCGHARECDLVA